MGKEHKTPQFLVDLSRPLPNQTGAERKVWSIGLNTIWVPYLTAQKCQGHNHISDEALGAPLRVGKEKDGSVRFGTNGKPVIRVVKELAGEVRTIRENFAAQLADDADAFIKSNPAAYRQQVEAQMKAGEPLIEADKAAVVAALKARAEAEARARALATYGQRGREPGP